MSKQITNHELARIVTKLLTDPETINNHLGEYTQFQNFMRGIAQAVCDACGGELSDILPDDGLSPNGEWLVGIHWNDSLPENGGVWKEYDTEADWGPQAGENGTPAEDVVVSPVTTIAIFGEPSLRSLHHELVAARKFDDWLQKNMSQRCTLDEGVGWLELAPASEGAGLRGAIIKVPALQKLVYELSDGRLGYWDIDTLSMIQVNPEDSRLHWNDGLDHLEQPTLGN